SVHVDEHFGTDRDTPQIRVNVADQLADEIVKTANWSAQLPRAGDGFVTLADIKAGTDVLAHPLGTLVFQQKLVPFELRMAKASGSQIDGANEFFAGALQLTQDGQGVPSALHAEARGDFFAAAQFLEMSQDDKLAKPSFESFTAGYELGDDNYDIGEVIEETLNYEEADLGAVPVPKRSRRIGLGAYAEATHGALLRFGAAGRSNYRDRALTQPAQSTAMRVDPAPVTVASKDSMVVATGAQVYTSVWRAHQARDAASSVEAASLAVVEVAEIA
ncbi:MAG: hypothetical protein ACRD2I_20830, partial [Vicinamibacterales bacterium]